MAVRIEDAGFEIRDMIAWIYGSGFPKSLNVSKAIDKAAGAECEVDPAYRLAGDASITAPDADRQWQGWGTTLKPALEPITVARKPLIGTVIENVLAHGAGALNIDGCRVEPIGESRERVGEASQERRYTENGGTNFAAIPGVRGGDPTGRWPANVIHDGSDEVLAAFPDAKVQQGALTGQEPSSKTTNTIGEFVGRAPSEPRGDTGSAARFFYCAKASRKDRNDGLEDPGPQFKRGTTLRDVENAASTLKGNTHPTVKPTDLMRYPSALGDAPWRGCHGPIHGQWQHGQGLHA